MTRSNSPRTTTRKTRTRKAAAPAPVGFEAALVALREEVAALRRDVAQQAAAIGRARLDEIPRAEDYEPLVGPLREFTRVSPVLAETLASIVKAVTPLPALVRPLQDAAESLRRERQPPVSDAAARSALTDAVARMAAARAAIRDGLATLPRDRSYAAAAAHLRELATVSPSLMEWMNQLPAIRMPLAESVTALEQAARELEDAEQGVRRLLASDLAE